MNETTVYDNGGVLNLKYRYRIHLWNAYKKWFDVLLMNEAPGTSHGYFGIIRDDAKSYEEATEIRVRDMPIQAQHMLITYLRETMATRNYERELEWSTGYTEREVLVQLFNTGDRDGYNKPRVGYALYLGGRLLFAGEELYTLHGAGSYRSLGDLLAFLTLQDGDIDDEHFDEWTTEQLEWRDSPEADEVRMIVYDWEESWDMEVWNTVHAPYQ